MAISVTNGTAALHIGISALGIGPGDEVIVPAITFIATMAYPLGAGAKLVFADIDPKTLNMDPADVARKTAELLNLNAAPGIAADAAPIVTFKRQEPGATCYSCHGKGKKNCA